MSINGDTKEERAASKEAIQRAEKESKQVWNRIGWNVYLIKAVECKAFGTSIKEVEYTPFETVLEYFSLQNALIT